MNDDYDPKKFYPIDLMWEGTRRNEEYKREYQDFVSSNDSGLWYSGKWLIFPKLFDPTISIHTIKERLLAGERFEEVHPYWQEFKRGAVSAHQLPPPDSHCTSLANCDRIGGDFFLIESLHHRHYYCISEMELAGRLVVSINPYSTEASVKKAIEKIMKAEKTRLRKKSQGEGTLSARPDHIEGYINDLEKYDQLVKTWHDPKYGSLKEERGFLLKPKKYQWHWDMLPSTRSDKKERSSSNRAHTRFYNNVKYIIQNTPNLEFDPAKQ